MLEFLSQKNAKTVIKLLILPGSSKSEVIGIYGEPIRLKVKIMAPPEGGRANGELIALFARILKISRGRIEIVKGETSKQKDLSVDLSIDEVRKIFSEMKLC